ncbi:MAG: methyltransferase domain-containing protein [Planctomycetes bacterium]|nr:methyltransferase domain-containing protein [Planctomycetota bacterium]
MPSPLDPADVRSFYDSDVVIETFNDSFGGLWHTPLGSPRFAGIRDVRHYLCSWLGIDPDHEVLDFGSGVGPTSCDLARYSGCRVRGLNVSAKQVEIARQFARLQDLQGRVSFDLFAGGRLPYGDGAFDRVVFFESVCHVPDKAALFAEFFRVLRPGGIVGGQDWMLPDRPIAPEEFDRYLRPIEVAIAVSLLSMEGYRELLQRAGFRRALGVDARRIFADMGMPPGGPLDEPIRVEGTDDMAARLRKGNAAIGIAYARGLFTVGFVSAERPGFEDQA